MKPYCVVRTIDAIDMFPVVFRGTDNRTYQAHVVPTKDTDSEDLRNMEGDSQFTNDVSIAFCDNEHQANMAATKLSELFPHQKYMVMQSKALIYRDPGPTQRAEFREEGLIPV